MRPTKTLLRGLVVAMIPVLACSSLRGGEEDRTGLVGWWRFDETPGMPYVEDSSPHGLTGDLRGVSWATGAFGSALHFSGRNSFVRISVPPALLDGSNELTVQAWVLWEGTGQYPNIITGGRWSPGGFLLFVNGKTCSFRLGRPGHQAGRPGDQWREVGVTLLEPLPMGRWVHLAAVFKRPEIRVLVDGKVVGRARWDYPIGFSGDLILGKWAGVVCHTGLLDEVKVFNRARSTAEILADVEATRAGRDQAEYTLVKVDTAALPRALVLENELASLHIGAAGRILALIDKRDGRNLLVGMGTVAAMRVGDRWCYARACRVEGDRLILDCGPDRGMVLRVTAPGPWFEFELLETTPKEGVSAVVCPRLNVAPSAEIGAMAGLARDDTYGVCLRALNLRTHVDVRAGRNQADMSGSTGERYGIRGMHLALVAGHVEALPDALRRLTEASGVPLSHLGGAFSMTAPENRGSYLFANVSEANVQAWIDTALRGGFTHIHYSGWWHSLGHYDPSSTLFPHGLAGMAETVQTIHAAGLKAGMHTLTGCIATNDAWVTPTPDPRLAADATYTLARPLGRDDTTIFLKEKPAHHDVVWSYSGKGNALRIGSELIRYRAISATEPFAFRKCERGAFKTVPAAHGAGDRVDHLRQHYLAFYPDEDSTLVGELADCIAGVYNRCRMDQIYMDGAEGMGAEHPIAVMRGAIYERLRRPALVEASCHGHHNWWFHSRLGAWDHPKWGFKPFVDMHITTAERYRRTDLMDPQMGWWALIGPSSISRGQFPDEVEYFMAKCLGIDAAMSIQGVTVGQRPPNARQDEYFTMIGRYERLRRARYFNDAALEVIRRPGTDVHLSQREDGTWCVVPRVYRKHRVADGMEGSRRWTITNPFARQAPALRLEALYSAAPYDTETAVILEDFSRIKAFSMATAPGVSLQIAPTAGDGPPEKQGLELVARNTSPSRRGAWAVAAHAFSPYKDLRPGNAMGLWIKGDGNGELLNVQLSNPREHTIAYAEHYLTIDFTGWRYVQLLLRERDAESYHHYKWPYFGQHEIYRNPLKTDVVSKLALYLNHLPPGEECRVRLGPIHFLPIHKTILPRPVVTLAGTPVSLPVDLESGEYVEVDAAGRGTHYDERGAVQAHFLVEGGLPPLASGVNSVSFDHGASHFPSLRAEITVICAGPRAGGPRPEARIDWAQMRREYEMPRLLTTSNPPWNTWWFACRKGPLPTLEGEIDVLEIGRETEAYIAANALVLDDASDPQRYQLSQVNTYSKYAYDDRDRGVPAKPGVTHELSVVPGRYGQALRYEATSLRPDSTGWSAKGRRFDPPLDLSACEGLGFWLHGDGKGEIFKVQLRDTKGQWLDMVTRVSFTGWRYREFRLDRPELDLSKIEYLIIYYNGIPEKTRVSCIFDDFRGVRNLAVLPPLRLRIGDHAVVFPVSLKQGQALKFRGAAARVIGPKGETLSRVVPEGGPWQLRTGRNNVRLEFVGKAPKAMKLRLSLVKIYPE